MKILVLSGCLGLFGASAFAGGHGDVFSKGGIFAPSPKGGHGDVFSKPSKVTSGGHGDVFASVAN